MDSQKPLYTPEYVANNLNPELIVVSKGSVLFQEGDPNDFVYYVLDGEIKISQKNFVVGLINSHEFFGINSCLSEGSCYAFSSRAKTTSNLYRIDKNNFKALLLKDGDFSRYIIKVLCDRIRKTDLKTTTFLSLPGDVRVIQELLDNTNEVDAHLIISLTYNDLSELTGVSLRSVKRIIEDLIQRGQLEKTEDDCLLVVDSEKLKTLLV